MTQAQALDILKSGANVFLTGEPGSGKTHTINQYIAYLRACGIEPAITASTGIAATHIGGMTIHAWSGIGIKKTLTPYELDRLTQFERVSSRVRRAKVLIIDEISMLDAETFGTVERVCRTLRSSGEAFGGLQVVAVGDFFQLPPIGRYGETAPRFAYEATAWEQARFISAYLTEQYRQDDAVFLDLLGKLRRGEIDEMVGETLSSRRIAHHAETNVQTKLFSHNADVDRINAEKLDALPGSQSSFRMTSRGAETLVANLKRGCLSPELLNLKKGAAVMCTKNNIEAGYVNGTLGTITDFSPGTGEPIIMTKDKRSIVISAAEWAIEDEGRSLASITQLPLRLAWAITIHKSQGMTLDEAVIDLSGAFEYGQGYVALSRVRSLSGLHLLGWNRRSLEVHPTILLQDEIFRRESDDGEKHFVAMARKEVDSLHKNFCIGVGGKWPPDPRLLRKRAERQAAAGKPKIPTIEQTLLLFRGGKHSTIDAIATERGLKAGTIIDHLNELKDAQEIATDEIRALFAKKPKMIKIAEETKEAFASLGGEALKPVFDAFGGKYSYDELKIARLLQPSVSPAKRHKIG